MFLIKEGMDWIGYWILRGGAFLFQRLPLDFSLAVGRRAGRIVCLFHQGRRVAYANLKAAFGESSVHERKRWIREMFQHLGMMAVEIMRFPILKKEDIERYIETDLGYRNYYLNLRQHKKSTILLTAHFGNWEFSQMMEAVEGRPLPVFSRRQKKYKRLYNLLNTFRRSHRSVAIKEGLGIRDLIRILRQGETVGVLGDQGGGEDGVWIRFFGQLTTSPRGVMELALKLGAYVIPVFLIRHHGPYHQLLFETPLPLIQTGDLEKDVQTNIQHYIHMLEFYIRKYPSQWLWLHKRWKWNRTQRITILSDGKPGHVKQSEAFVQEMLQIGSETNPPYEFLVDKVEVRFRSLWHKRLFYLWALFFIPWAQGRLSWLRFFFTPECAEKLEKTSPRLVVSAGASLVPLNLCLQKENLAKSVVLMKPSFPYNLFRYDLALIPYHDRGLLPRGSIRIHGAFSTACAEIFENSRKRIAGLIRDPQRVKLAVFLGGETGGFKPDLSEIERLLKEVEQASEELGGDFLLTTSRRTPKSINQFLQHQFRHRPRCQLCVIASQDPRPEVVPGMMALADFLVVTEDSLSMIAEALSSGKRVVVVQWAKNGLSSKHYRFQETLKKEWGVPVIEAGRLCETLLDLRKDNGIFRQQTERERMKIRERLKTLF